MSIFKNGSSLSLIYIVTVMEGLTGLNISNNLFGPILVLRNCVLQSSRKRHQFFRIDCYNISPNSFIQARI